MNVLFEEFQEFRKILCICPRCNELVRVSDLHFKLKSAAPRTWLDDYEKRSLVIDNKETKFGEIEEKLREIATNKGRKAAAKVFNNAISPSFRALKLDPLDVKPILNPVDFVVFKGMNKNDLISDIIFLSKKYDFPTLSTIQSQVETIISKNNYEWQVARIDDKGNIVFE